MNIAAITHCTPEDMLNLPDSERYELIDGTLVERNMSFWSSYIAGEVYALLRAFCREKKLGWVAPEGASYQCFPGHPTKVRRADVSFLRADRLSTDRAIQEGHLRQTPDLVVEVISPKGLYYEVEEKVTEWLGAGVRVVWVVNPRTRQVRIHRADGSDATVREKDQLSGEDVVPGFTCRVGDLFQPPPGAAPVVEEAAP
jgi:Uma2 family endonuclease